MPWSPERYEMIYLMGGVCVLMLWERGGERRREEERECVCVVCDLLDDFVSGV